jgi:hypothetical protein
MTVFRSKTFKKNRSRIQRKLWRARATRGTRHTRRLHKSQSKQRGGYVPYRKDPKGGTYADVLDWDDQKPEVA